jgi:hypothetical protein
MAKHSILPVWFFAGVLLSIYGVMIFVSGMLEWSAPQTTVLAELHAPVWWGAVLAVVGGSYVAVYRPK